MLKQSVDLDMLSQFLESVIDNASIWINVLDTSGQITIWNKAAEQISGYSRQEVIGNQEIWEWLYPSPDYRKEINEFVVEILDRGKEVEGFETQISTKSGTTKTISWNSRRFFDKENNVIGSIAIGQDVTDHKKAERALVESERQLSTLMANIPGMAYRCVNDEFWTMKFVSNGCHKLTGYSSEAFIDNRDISYASIVHKDDSPRLLAEIRSALNNDKAFAVEYRIRRKDGKEIWVWEQGQKVLVDGEEYLEGIVTDISQRKTMELELKKLAAQDALTGLYTRREFVHQFRDELDRAGRYHRPLSLLWIDVDNFKSINDRYGHLVGDEVLRQLGQLFQSCIRNIDYAGRYGGEEFVVILPELDQAKAIEMAERVRKVVEERKVEVDATDGVFITISIGVASFPTHGVTPESLFEVADQAMYKAKRNGRNKVCTFS
jgi:diguanylate cyclase (GGDEF)-like protein/PAS domain S-box-containing protein